MSISIKNLSHDSRDVGKTIKSTKKYYVWEFVLSGKYHKVEMFHSKMSGKKKLCVDAQMITENKSFKNDFTYSFKIEKNYFNVVQLNNDKFDMRIDNRSFDIILQEERSGKLRTEVENETSKVSKKSSFDNGLDDRFSKFEQVPGNLRSIGRTSNTGMNPRNSQDNFFNDQDFDFNGGGGNNFNANFNTRSSVGGVSAMNRKSTNLTVEEKNMNTFNDFNEFNNKFSSGFRQSLPVGRSNTNPTSISGGPPTTIKSGNTLLVDVNEIYSDTKKSSVQDSKEILKNINFDMGGGQEEIYLQNQKALQNFDVSQINGEENWNHPYSNTTSMPNINNGSISQVLNQNTFDFTQGNINVSNKNNTGMLNNTNTINANINSNIGSGSISNIQNINFPNYNDAQNSSNNFVGTSTNLNQNSNPNNINNNNTSTTGSQEVNDFKKKIIGSGLVNFDNLLEDKKKNSTVINPISNNYNFNFGSGGMPINYINDTQYKNINQNPSMSNMGGFNQGMPMNVNMGGYYNQVNYAPNPNFNQMYNFPGGYMGNNFNGAPGFQQTQNTTNTNNNNNFSINYQQSNNVNPPQNNNQRNSNFNNTPFDF